MKFHILDPTSFPPWIQDQTLKLQAEISKRLNRRTRILLTDSVAGAVRSTKSGKPSRVILLNPNILEGLGNTREGLKAWRGVGLHEVGHIENPAWDEYRQAEVEGFDFILNVVDDEQNERRLSRKEKALRECFAYIGKWITSRNRKARQANHGDPFSYVNLANDFLYHLRKPCAPPRIMRFLAPAVAGALKKFFLLFKRMPAPLRKALNLIPIGLTELSKPSLLNLSREIHEMLLAGATPGTYEPSKLESPCGCSHGNHSDHHQHTHSSPPANRPSNSPANPLPPERTDQLDKPPADTSSQSPVEEQPIAPFDLAKELGFDLIEDIQNVEPDLDLAEALLPEIIPAAQEMRRFLADCGWAQEDLEDQESGAELVDDLERYYLGDTNICIDDEIVARATVNLQVVIDCSGSSLNLNPSGSQPFALAKRFGLLVEQATVDLRGVSAHLWGFTDTKIFDCGEPGELRVSGLKAMPRWGNNDSAALWHAAQHASLSGKQLKVLLMISDGRPSECSWQSLNELVIYLESCGYICVQVATADIENPAFERFFIDLSKHSLEAAVMDFGQIIVSLLLNGAPF